MSAVCSTNANCNSLNTSMINPCKHTKLCLYTRAEQLNKILSKSQCHQVQYLNGRSCSFLITVKCVTAYIINEALWCYRDAPAFKSHSPDVRKHTCFLQSPAKKHIIIILFVFFSVEMQKLFALFVKIIKDDYFLHIVHPVDN